MSVPSCNALLAKEQSASNIVLSSPPLVSPLSLPSHVIGDDISVEGLAHFIVENDTRNILVLLGAGASVAAGIPDFRSPKTGIYDNLESFNLESPTDAFSIPLLRENPRIFYAIAAKMNLWPGCYRPTLVHRFLRLLEKEGRLLRVCTQNIDGLEEEAGVSSELVIQAHGNFRQASCIDCHASFDIEQHRNDVMNHKISTCLHCKGIIKPNVVFFGEQLPEKFFSVMLDHDVSKAEMILIVGTSLQVQPVAMIPFLVPSHAPRVLINAERVGGRGFRFPQDVVEEAEDTQSDKSKTSCSSSSSCTSFDALHNNFSPSAKEKQENGNLSPRESTERKSNSSARSSCSSSSSDGFIQHMDHHHNSSVLRDLFFSGDCQEVIKKLAEGMGLSEKLEDVQS